jgi:CRP-like cAMP-binding protein
VDAFTRALHEYPELRDMVERYTVAMMNQIMQSTACNHVHTVQQRMCRWLLMTHDRVGEDEFKLTQEFLAQMLGVRRPSVTVAAGKLQKAALISYQRGRIRVLDRAGLEARACECYAVVRREFERLLPEPSSSKDNVELRPALPGK